MKILNTLQFLTLFIITIFCSQTVFAQDPCIPDVMGPIVACNDLKEFTPDPNDEQIVLTSDILEFASDNCTALTDLEFFITDDLSLSTPPTTPSLIYPAGTEGIFTIVIWAVDEAGNASQCWGNISINYTANNCSPDMISPVAICEDSLFLFEPLGTDFLITADMLNDGSYDNCTGEADLQFFLTTDPTLTSPPTTETVTFPSGSNSSELVFMWVVDEAGLYNVCANNVELQTTLAIQGNVFVDEDQDCSFDPNNEAGIGGYKIRYTIDQGISYTEINTNINGAYAIVQNQISGGSEITIELLLNNGMSTGCITSATFPLPLTDILTLDFPIQLQANCEDMIVDVSTPILRKCFAIPYYVNYCNHSAFDIDDVEVEVVFPTEMVINSANLPFTNLGNNTLIFDLGTVSSGDCGAITISVTLDCTVPTGAIKCAQASISPNTCSNSQAGWNGSNLRVEAECDEINQKVQFTITNEGDSGMPSTENYIVVEDVIMYMTEPIQLGAGQSEVLEFPANGSTWRVEIPQESGHPSLSIPAAYVEGCGGYGSMGYINQFSTPDNDPFLAIDCQEVVASYDPNDKQAFPIGYSEEHFIQPNTSLEYKIRFQNTGTDTAFTVRIEDRLSGHLDYSSIQAGASSHPYRMELKEDGLLIFHFENILLPDSTTNEPESNGFVQFRIQQLADNPIGTVIENTADIYFDFNEAIITNTVFHTLGENFILTSTIKTTLPQLEVNIAPNPFDTYTIFTLQGVDITDGIFELYDLSGRQVHQDQFSQNQYQLQKAGLASGTYFFRIFDERNLLANGKVVIQ